jgi:DNA-binding PadR family transcriptional regulator
MNRSSSEEFLIERGLQARRSAAQRQVLGCVACQWNKQPPDGEPVVYARQIAECSGIRPGTIGPMLHRFRDKGIMDSKREDADPKIIGRPLRTYYSPADTELGAAFASKLVVPRICGLTEDSADASTSYEVAEPSGNSAVLELIDNSSPEELASFITYAKLRIKKPDNQ